MFIEFVNNQRSQVSLPWGAEPCLSRPAPGSDLGEEAWGCRPPPELLGIPAMSPPTSPGTSLLSSGASCAFCRGGCWIHNQHLIIFSLQFHKCSLGLTVGLPWGLKPWPQSQVDLGLNLAKPLAKRGTWTNHLSGSVSLSVNQGDQNASLTGLL